MRPKALQLVPSKLEQDLIVDSYFELVESDDGIAWGYQSLTRAELQ